MKFDSSQAWRDASSAVNGNRDVLLALAGVFLALPAFAMGLFMPPPPQPKDVTPEASIALLGQYYTHAWPALLGLALVSLLGTLTMLTLFTDRSRPTVSEAIRQGAKSVLPVVGAQLLFGFAIATAVTVLIGIATLTGQNSVKLLAGLLCLVGLIYAAVRTSLVSPVVVVEGQRNPVAALRRSWQLTGGNVLPLLAFYVLLLIAFAIIYLLVASGLGMVIALITSGSVTAMINNLIAACLQAVMSIYTVAIAAACHRQLAGPSAASVQETFS
ncbi:MAG: glycerophosphoryl diester phosphodiesterase membrane domain-containing protein [Proteobacteria bacterium]|nr:glycerophosphoryl diester phosphodiesterase membrane domain-containing protein [Pseudomonadota bacterium]